MITHVASTPYEALGGTAWLALPASVQALHGPGLAHGRLEVKRGTHPIAVWLAQCLRLPSSDADTPIKLSVVRVHQHLVWRRRFGDTQLITEQHACDGLLVERFGALELRFLLVITATGFDYVQQHAAMMLGRIRIPIPAVFAPIVHAVVRAAMDGVAITVGVRLPWIGPLLSYRGVLHAEAETP